MEITKVALQEDGSYQVNDSMCVPNDMGNRHRVMLQEWIDAGNTPSPFVGPSALEVWQQEMAESDTLIPRWAEDLYDALPLEVRDAVDPVTKNAIADKKAQRQLRPV